MKIRHTSRLLIALSILISLPISSARRKPYVLDPNFENEVDNIYQTQVNQFLSLGKIPMPDNRQLCKDLPMCLHSEYNSYVMLAKSEDMIQQVDGILANLESGFESLEFRVKHGVPDIDLKTYFNYFKKFSSNVNLETYYKVRVQLYQNTNVYSFDLTQNQIKSQLENAVKVYNSLYSKNLNYLDYDSFKKLEAVRWLLMSSSILSRWDTENDNELGIYDGYRNAEGHHALQLLMYRYKITMKQVLDYYHMCNGELDLYTLHKGLAHMEIYAINKAIRGKVDLVYDLPPLDMSKYNKIDTSWTGVPKQEKGVIATQAQLDADRYRKEQELANARKRVQEAERAKQSKAALMKRLRDQQLRKLAQQQKERDLQRQREQQEILQRQRADQAKIDQQRKNQAAKFAAKLAEQRRKALDELENKRQQQIRAERRKLEQELAEKRRQEQQNRWVENQRKIRAKQRQRQAEAEHIRIQERRQNTPTIINASAEFSTKKEKCNKNFHEAGLGAAEKRRRMICAFS